MSRCFPFPPPGYEKKPTLDDSDLLKKEKRKEKKHKKDKKDREKKEKKEDKSENKHKEKKDKKDKNKDKKKDKDKSSVHLRNGEHKEHLLKNGELPIENKVKGNDIDNAKFVQEFGRRIRDDEKQTSTALQFPVEIKKSTVDRGDIPIEIKKSTVDRADIPKLDAKTPPLDKEKIREKEKDEKRKKKDRDKEKGRPKEEKVKEKNELFMNTERDKNRYAKNIDTIGSFNNLSTKHTPNVNVQHAGSELKKRKDMETNDFFHENEPRPNKTARSTSSILTENGRKLDCPELSLPSKHRPSMGNFKVDNNNNHNNNKERKVNGIIASQPMTLVSKRPPITTPNHILRKPTPSRSSPPVTTTQPPPVPTTKPPSSVPNRIVTQLGPVSKPKPPPVANNKVAAQLLPNPKKKPPHPDTRYLKQILQVPTLEIWSGEDDQDWLFSGKNNRDFKNIIGGDSLRDNDEVWAEAKHLESVDIYALPYVIPY